MNIAIGKFLKEKLLNQRNVHLKCWSVLPNWGFPGGPLAKTTPNTRGLGLMPGQGTRFHMPQLSSHAIMKIPLAATKTKCSKINKY